MSGFVEEYRKDFRTPVPFVAWVVLSVIVAFAGPFGSYEALSFPARALFWSVTIGAGVIVGTAIRAFVHGVLGLRDLFWGSGVIAVIVTLVFTPSLYLIVGHFFPLWLRRVPGLIEIAVFIFLVSYGIGVFRHALWAAEAGRSVTEAAVGAPTLPRLFARIDPALHGQLMLVSVRDHYVDVLTDSGKTSLLMRFSDAIGETAPEPGARVHRSYWVAWAAVAGVERHGTALRLRLKDGTTVPVSRAQRAIIEARGLI